MIDEHSNQPEDLRERIARRLHLTPNESRIMELICRRELASKVGLMAALYDHRSDGGPHDKIIDIFVCKIRRKIKPLGIEIKTRRGQGYFLDGAGKTKVLEICGDGASI